MTRAEFDTLCGAHPGATLSGPGELDAWKVGGKLFAVVGAMDGGVSVKCPDVETADMLKDAGVAQKAAWRLKRIAVRP